ncbi:sororin isoform X2 [Phascolarctos cinereus]|uniref:Sororin isoform X2 n=1 Tax=Phascolarctos cinereus TaxID=38626 RepID=A0A6P5INJ3_PHACI|nr:sororin isoform X2 [Phascolarctos cinereus]
MSARRSRSRSRSGARRSVPESPPSPAPALRRSQRKSGSAPEAPPQATSPGAQKSITVKKIGPQTPEAFPPVARKPITVKKPVARTTEAVSPAAHEAVSLKETMSPSPEASPDSPTPTSLQPWPAPTSQGHKSAAKKNVSPSAEVAVVEKENHPPVQESTPLDKGSSPVTTGPAPEVTSAVLGPLTPDADTRPGLLDARDLEMSRKVRRSYSRLDDLGLGSSSTSTPSYRRRSFFGFEMLLSGEELENISPVVEKEPKSQAVAPATEPSGPDFTLPGITVTKEKRRKRRAPEILVSVPAPLARKQSPISLGGRQAFSGGSCCFSVEPGPDFVHVTAAPPPAFSVPSVSAHRGWRLHSSHYPGCPPGGSVHLAGVLKVWTQH